MIILELFVLWRWEIDIQNNIFCTIYSNHMLTYPRFKRGVPYSIFEIKCISHTHGWTITAALQGVWGHSTPNFFYLSFYLHSMAIMGKISDPQVCPIFSSSRHRLCFQWSSRDWYSPKICFSFITFSECTYYPETISIFVHENRDFFMPHRPC